MRDIKSNEEPEKWVLLLAAGVQDTRTAKVTNKKLVYIRKIMADSSSGSPEEFRSSSLFCGWELFI
jgi:hypothetical protein